MEQASIEKEDITEVARSLVLSVQRLSTTGKWNTRNFTLNHLVDIWRGSKVTNQKTASESCDYVLTNDSSVFYLYF